MKTLNVIYHVKPGMTDDFIEALYAENIGGISKSEDGCEGYDYFVSLEDEDTVLLIEHWRDDAALEAHSKAPHFAVMQAIKEQFVESTEIRKYNEN